MNVRIVEIIRFCSFEEMCDRFGVASAFPCCLDVEHAVASERTFRKCQRLERIHGVFSFIIHCVLDVTPNYLPHPVSSEQQTTHRIVTRITQEAVRFYIVTMEQEAMSTRVDML